MPVCIQEKGEEREGPPAPTFSIAYSSSTNGGILSPIFHMYAVALGQFSEYGVMTFQPIREVT